MSAPLKESILSSLKPAKLSISFERSLKRVLRNWAETQAPPAGSRAQLLRMAGDVQMQAGEERLFFSRSNAVYEPRPSEIFSLLYAPHMSYVSAWINF